LGLSPTVLHGLLHADDSITSKQDKGKGRANEALDVENEESKEPANDARPKAVYELTKDGDRIEPRLRLWLASSEPTASSSKHAHFIEDYGDHDRGTHARVAVFLDSPERTPSNSYGELTTEGDNTVEVAAKDLVMLSEPLENNPKESLVWSLQRRSHELVDHPAHTSGWDSTSSADVSPTQTQPPSLPAVLENREYVLM
jgi:hypothetical protein